MADTTISNLPNAATLTGTERVPMDQGATTVDATTQAIANLAPPTNLTYDAATRLLSSSTGEDVTLPLVNTTAAGLIPHTWLTGAEAAILPHIHGALAGVVYEHVRNVSGATMAALTPYHVVNSQGDTDRVQIIPADASDPASMPASGILMTALANNEDGHGVIAGVPTGLNTAANPSGTVLYVGVGVLTPTAPAANVQAIAIVGRSHASTGTLSMIGGTSLARVAYTGSYGDLIGLPTLGTAAAAATTDFAPASQGVTNGNSHNHDGGDGAQIAYSSLLGLPGNFTSSTAGLVPASGGGTTNFLRADGTFAAPPGGGSPGGTGTEIQYRSDATTFGAIAGSSVDPATGNTTFSARWINARNSAADAPANTMTGTWFTGGTSTTTKPHFLIEPSTVTTSNGWSTAGTGFGINAPSGFAGNLLDFQVNGTRRAAIDSTGVYGRPVSNVAGVVNNFLIKDTTSNIGIGTYAGTTLILSTNTNSGTNTGGVAVNANQLILSSTHSLCWVSTGGSVQTTPDLFVRQDAPNTLAQRNSTFAQTARIYNTFTSDTNFERLNIRWTSNEAIIDTEAGSGGGTLRGLKIGSASTSLLGFYGATPVARGAAIPDATDLSSALTSLNALLARTRAEGRIAT